ncbi:hypothetical protein SARC_05879 [Sphaeroforma arctica JP610]|uniref:Fe2OG dioxygenase domain-containing protein n=1 Tax=Sphaeroforma arctica JP610 TaxID=667725 RepID=A0A0L0FYA2_9EUKA|nr:hypothetical protein SARC_05879 [Sphaeroforma arctica JP610]KNC81815.1 hypothetical protein SARC_05879 [Sphaeroforma arctica JP610]|eukprot:XP_014155717.1 hypothetical protein SARC_05879 [Sphaeroforma arctica JP610]
MGKTAKKAAKRRQQMAEMERTANKRAKTNHASEIETKAAASHTVPMAQEDDYDGFPISREDLQSTLRTLELLVTDRALFGSERLRPLRKLLHPLTEYYQSKAGASNSAFKRISDALKEEKWTDALLLLEGLRGSGHAVKLGTVQRWVRDALIVCPKLTDATTVKVLDAILRVANAEWDKVRPDDKEVAVGTVIRHPSWVPTDKPAQKPTVTPAEYLATPTHTRSPSPTVTEPITAANEHSAESTAETTSPSNAKKWQPSVVAFEKAAERRPPNRYDLRIWQDAAKLHWDATPPCTTRHNVEFVDKAFLLDSVLSPNECAQILSLTHNMGYDPDEPIGGSQSLEDGVAREGRAQACVWLAGRDVVETIFDRVKGLVDESIGECKVSGINARFRCYRYVPGNLYGPHVDGAWPGSGIVDGEYQYDAFGNQWSKMTFLIYLNDDFEGGDTTFYLPGPVLGSLDARGVAPRTGSVLVFPHGDTSDSLVHEGSSVFTGNKFVIRTDLLYTMAAKNTSMHNKHMKHNDEELKRMRR